MAKIYILQTVSIFHEVLGPLCATFLALKVVKIQLVYVRRELTALQCFVLVLEKPNTPRPGLADGNNSNIILWKQVTTLEAPGGHMNS